MWTLEFDKGKEWVSISDPSSDAVERSIHELDNRHRTLTILNFDEQIDLLVGGGKEGRVIVEYRPVSNLGTVVLTNPDVADKGKEIELTIQGVSQSFPAYCVVSKEIASTVAT